MYGQLLKNLGKVAVAAGAYFLVKYIQSEDNFFSSLIKDKLQFSGISSKMKKENDGYEIIQNSIGF